MRSQKKSPRQFILLTLCFVLVAAAFHYYSPLQIQTDQGEQMELPVEEVIGIIPNEKDGTFFVEFRDSTVSSTEKFNAFRRRARFNQADYLPLIRTPESRIDHRVRAAEDYPCDPHVEGYNVFQIRGFVYLDPVNFIVIDDKRSFSDCPCDDPKVIRGIHPKCPTIHHRTKTEILNRARECGLGDWFPMEKCESPFNTDF